MNNELCEPMVYLSKYNWKSGMNGIDFYFSVGDKAKYRGKDGTLYPIIIKSELRSHANASGFVREVQFSDGLFAVDASKIEPVFD